MYTGVPENLTSAELFARRQMKLTEKKEMIAEIALLVIENPEENVCSKLITRRFQAFFYAGAFFFCVLLD